MEEFVKVMKALSDPNRIKIIKMLQQRKMFVCEIQAVLQIAQPTVSKHLKLLENAGLVRHMKDGLWVSYYLSEGETSPYAATLMGNMKHWLNQEPEIVKIARILPTINGEEICSKTRPSKKRNSCSGR